MNRILHIDFSGSLEETPDLVLIRDRRDILDLLNQAQHRTECPLFILDCRDCSVNLLCGLLKFLEDYDGELVLYARDPVPRTILSRFPNTRKHETPLIHKDYESLVLRNLDEPTRERLIRMNLNV